MGQANGSLAFGRVALLLSALAAFYLGTATCAYGQGGEHGHDQDYAALLKELPKSKHGLAEGIRQVSHDPETAISAKFELKDGKLMLSVYTAGEGLDNDAEHNVLKEYLGSPESEGWNPEVEVFEDVAHVARSAQQQTLAALSPFSLLDVIERAELHGTVFSITPILSNRKPIYRVLVASEGRVVDLTYPLGY